MRFAFLAYCDECLWEYMEREERHKRNRAQRAALRRADRAGCLVTAARLAPTHAAATVFVTENGRTRIIDQPFSDTTEQLARFMILECNDLDEAVGYAKMWMTEGETVEIRPLRSSPSPLVQGARFQSATLSRSNADGREPTRPTRAGSRTFPRQLLRTREPSRRRMPPQVHDNGRELPHTRPATSKSSMQSSTTPTPGRMPLGRPLGR
jgi:hypothetical protein